MLYKAHCRSGKTVEVDVTWKSKAGIMGIHKAIDESGWAVTHLATGIRIERMRTKKAAVELAKDLLRECPPSTWVFITESSSIEAIRAVLNKYGEHNEPVCELAKAYEQKLIKTKLTKALSV